MEPEILKTHETKIGHIQQKSYQVVPAYCLNYIRIINTKGVAEVSVSQIKKIAEKLSPNDVFPQINGFSENQFQELAEKLLTIKDIEFLYTLCTIVFMCSDEGIDILERCDAKINVEHQGEKVVGAYLNKPDEFETALTHLLLTSVTTDKTYHVFQSTEQIPEIEGLKIPIQEIESECRRYFENSNYGKVCELNLIRPINKDNRWGFSVDHGTNLKSEVKINDKDKIVHSSGRNLIRDFAVYNPSLKLVFTSSRSAKHCRFYSKIISKAFWGNEDLFTTQVQLDLSFVKRQNIQQLLTNSCIGKVKQIQVKKIRSTVKNINKHKTIVFQPPIGKSCLTHGSNLVIEGNIMEVELKITSNMDEETKSRSQKLILKPTTVRSSQLISPLEIQHIFERLELINNENV